MLGQLTLFAEGSLAKTYQARGRGQASTEAAADYGPICPVWLASYDPATSSWRTSQLCLEGGLAEFSETWPRSGMMRSGTAYRLPPLVPRTGATGFGLWPTPTVGGGGHTLPEGTTRTGQTRDGRKQTVCLARYVMQTERKIWPTPSVCGNYNRKGASKTSGDGLATVIGGALNPTWVEWLMGFPCGWTDLEPWETP